jgi:hypothetical protein
MARYCFYCGRSLNAGEKCNCRTAGSRRADGDFSDKTGTADPRQKRDRSGGSQSQNKPPRSSGAFRRFVNAFNPFFQETETQGTAAQPKRKRARKAKPVRKPFNPQDFLLSIRRFAQYLTRPVDSIRGAVHTANRLHILLTLLIRGVAGGFFLVLFSKIPLVRSLLSLSLANVATDSGTINDLFVFFQGLGIFIVAPLTADTPLPPVPSIFISFHETLFLPAGRLHAVQSVFFDFFVGRNPDNVILDSECSDVDSGRLGGSRGRTVSGPCGNFRF